MRRQKPRDRKNRWVFTLGSLAILLLLSIVIQLRASFEPPAKEKETGSLTAGPSLVFPSALAKPIQAKGSGSFPGAVNKNSASVEGSKARQLLSEQKTLFVPNKGQWPEPVEFAVDTNDRAIFFTAEGIIFSLKEGEKFSAVKVGFLGHNRVKPLPVGQPAARFSYFRGREKDWVTDVPVYQGVIYNEIWPGIDLVYSSSEEGLKSEFILRPGAQPQAIKFVVEGAEAIKIDEKGDLVVSTPLAAIRERAPEAYQIINGKKIRVEAGYELRQALTEKAENKNNEKNIENASYKASLTGGRQGQNEPVLISSPGSGLNLGLKQGLELGTTSEPKTLSYGIFVGAYDSAADLIIDPVTIISGNYVGGPSFDYVYGIALDAAGYVYLTGFTYSASGFPVSTGPQLNFNAGGVDAFVAKLDPERGKLIYLGYLGGDDRDYAYDIAVDADGAAYVAGYTASRENSFPVFKGPGLVASGLYDAFIAKISPTGKELEYCGFVGGKENDFGRGVAVDEARRAHLTGYTLSDETSFPVKLGPGLNHKGGYDAFVARLSPSGEKIEYCGYVGGEGNDWSYGIAVDQEDAAYIAGATTSTENFFPVISGPDVKFNGNVDGFVAKVTSSGESLVYCGYIGGEGEDVATAVAVDDAGFAYITGYTASNENSFPVTFGPDLGYNGGYYDAFVAKVSASGTHLIYCGYIGGAGYDAGQGVTVDDRACAYVTGFTSSDPDSFPVKEGPDLAFHGSFDAFCAKLGPTGSKLDFCGYAGGSAADYGQDIAVEKTGTGAIYLAGTTFSVDIPFPQDLVAGLSFKGKRDAFITRYYENSITVTYPNGGEIWYSGFEKNITWFSVGKVGPVRIELSTDNGSTWQEIVAETENNGVFTWVVPEISSTTCLMRVSEADDGVPADTSDTVFVILNEPVIVITAPNGGEEWPVGSVQEITWVTGSAPVGDVKIEYSTDNGSTWNEIVGRTENDGVFEWEIPDTVSNQCLVRVSEADDGNPADISDAPFSIVPSQATESLRLKKLGKKAGEGGPGIVREIRQFKKNSPRGGSS